MQKKKRSLALCCELSRKVSITTENIKIIFAAAFVAALLSIKLKESDKIGLKRLKNIEKSIIILIDKNYGGEKWITRLGKKDLMKRSGTTVSS